MGVILQHRSESASCVYMTPKKKILYLITKSNWGGAQRYVYDLATHLPKNEYDVVVACGGSGELTERLFESKIRTVSISALNRDMNIAHEVVVFFSLITLLVHEQPDILHVNSSKIGGLGACAGRLMFVPHIVFTAHGWAFNENRPWFARKLIAFLHWLTIVFSHTTIVVSDALQKDIHHLPFIRHKMKVIRNGIKVPALKTREKARHYLATKAELPSSSMNDLWVGTIAELHNNKGLEHALHAQVHIHEINSSARYLIIGEGEERDRLEQLIHTLGLEQHVFLIGSERDAASYLQAFDIFLLPSLTEALGFVLLEAGGAQLPVVASRVGGIPEIIIDKQTGLLVEPGNVQHISRALTYLLKNPNEGARLGKALHKHIAREFGLEGVLKETMRVYRLRS